MYGSWTEYAVLWKNSLGFILNENEIIDSNIDFLTNFYWEIFIDLINVSYVWKES